jgi:hypothetical protein
MMMLGRIAACLLGALFLCSPSRAEREVIAVSRFLAGDDGWSVVGSGVVGPTLMLKSLCAVGAAKGAWHWRAPAGKFNGNLSSAFGGQIVVERGYFEVNRGGQQELTQGMDITLESHKMGMSIGVAGLVEPGSFDMTHAVDLISPLWVRTDTGKPVSDEVLRRVLESMSGFTIRGGHHFGGEHAFLRQVVIKGPPPDSSHVSSTQESEASTGADKAAGKIGSKEQEQEQEQEETGLKKALREREKLMEGGGGGAVLIDARGGSTTHGSASGAITTLSSTATSSSHAAEEEERGGKQVREQEQEHKQEQDNRQQQAVGELRCSDDGASGLPVSKLMEASRVSHTPLKACLSGGKHGAFAISASHLHFQPASGGAGRVDIAEVSSVSIDAGSHVSIVGGGGATLLRGCKMEHFDQEELGAFFEAVLDAVSRASHP